MEHAAQRRLRDRVRHRALQPKGSAVRLVHGVLGTLQGDQLHLRALDPQDSRRIIRSIDGTLRGDTIVARVTGLVSGNDPGTRMFVRRPGVSVSFQR